MSRRFFSPIVEGHGEIEALPLLIRRIFAEFSPQVVPVINPPIRVKAGSFVNDHEYFHRYVRLAAAKAAHGGGEVLILLDCEDDCPATLGPSLLARAKSVRSDVPTTVVLAHCEYETWFLAAAESLRGCARAARRSGISCRPGADPWSQGMAGPADERILRPHHPSSRFHRALRSLPGGDHSILRPFCFQDSFLTSCSTPASNAASTAPAASSSAKGTDPKSQGP